MNPKVVIIILNWNGLSVTLDCIRSVKQTCYSHFVILLVDNDSTDGSFELAKELFPDIEFLKNQENLGFAGGNNQGIKFAFCDMAADFVVLLNNDTVVDSGWLKALVELTYRFPDIGVVGSKIFYFDKPEMIWCTGGSFGKWRGVPTQLRQKEIDSHLFEEPYDVDYVSGCSMLITRKAFKDVGYLDTDYFLYFEETDWCARAKRKGYRIMIAPQSYVWHKVGFTTGAVDSALHTYYMIRNNYAFITKNTFGIKKYLKLFVFLCLILKRYILRTIGKKNSQSIFRGVTRGLLDAITGKFGKAPDNIWINTQ